MIEFISYIFPHKEGNRWDKLPISNKPFICDLSLGNCTMYRTVAFFTSFPYRFFVGLESKGCFFFPCEGKIHPEYVIEKLNLMPGDAANIADWINVQLGIAAEEYGHYYIFHDKNEEESPYTWIKKLVDEYME